MLSALKLSAFLPSKTLGESLFIFEELDSTNAFALERARASTPAGTLILADKQTAGRGRFNRAWFSPADANIYGSLLCLLEPGFRGGVGWIPLMAGVTITQALEAQTGISIQLKWPNDLLVAEHKVGGILCESLTHQDHICVVIGFGINVNLSQGDFPRELRTRATSLQMACRHPLDRETLIMHIVTSLENGWNHLMVQGHAFWLQEYQKRCATLGQMIHVQFPDGTQFQGLAHSLGESGQLRIIPSPSASKEPSARMRDIHSGEIVHLRTTDSF